MSLVQSFVLFENWFQQIKLESVIQLDECMSKTSDEPSSKIFVAKMITFGYEEKSILKHQSLLYLYD
jgi:hypothetical protein